MDLESRVEALEFLVCALLQSAGNNSATSDKDLHRPILFSGLDNEQQKNVAEAISLVRTKIRRPPKTL